MAKCERSRGRKGKGEDGDRLQQLLPPTPPKRNHTRCTLGKDLKNRSKKENKDLFSQPQSMGEMKILPGVTWGRKHRQGAGDF